MAVKKETKSQENNSLRMKRIGLGLAAITVLVLVVFFLFNRPKAETPVVDEPDIGTLNMQTLVKAHKDYGKLQELLRQAASLSAEIELKDFELSMKAVEADKKLFEDAARQKANLEIITNYSQKMDELKNRADAIFQRMKPGFDREREELDKEYGNRILNLQLKADNAVVLELTDEQKQAIEAEWHRLKDERSQRQNELVQDQQRRYDAQVEAETGAERRSLVAQRESIAQKSRSEELEHLAQVQERNTQAIDEAIKPIQFRMDIVKKQKELDIKLAEIKLLQQKIFDDIAGRAAKLAIIHHLSLIIADPIDNIRGMEYDTFKIGDWRELRSPVMGINTVDLTEEMLEEMKNIQ